MTERKTNKKGNRGIGITITDLMNSVRLKIAVNNFNSDPMLLKSILTELCLEIFTCSKNTVIKKYNLFNGLTQENMLPLLRNIDIDDMLNLNIFWSLSPLEAKLYQEDPHFKLSLEERSSLLERLRKQMMEAV